MLRTTIFQLQQKSGELLPDFQRVNSFKKTQSDNYQNSWFCPIFDFEDLSFLNLTHREAERLALRELTLSLTY
jgi:hypothetical protein